MHEISATLSIVENLEKYLAEKKNTNQVLSVTISVGMLSTFVPESLEFAWDSTTADTKLQGSKLIIKENPRSNQIKIVEIEFSD